MTHPPNLAAPDHYVWGERVAASGAHEEAKPAAEVRIWSSAGGFPSIPRLTVSCLTENPDNDRIAHECAWVGLGRRRLLNDPHRICSEAHYIGLFHRTRSMELNQATDTRRGIVPA